MFADYQIWYRHASQPDIDDISNIDDRELKLKSLSELLAAAKKINITHMFIRGNIPPNLDRLAPNLKQLRLSRIASEDQLQR